MQTMLDLLAAHGAARGSAPAVLAPERKTICYAALHAGIDRSGEVLAALGLGRGNRIATALEDGCEAALATLAAMTWATCAPLNPRLEADACAALFEQLRVDALIVAEDDASALGEAAHAAGVPVLRLSVAAHDGDDLFTLRGESARAPIAKSRPRLDDVALVTHTSGTTLKPKVVPLTHRALLWSGRAFAIDASDRCLCVSPLHTTSGLAWGLIAPLELGASTVLVPGFDAAHFFEWLNAFEATFYSASPTVHAAIIDEFVRRRPSLPASLRFVRSSSNGMSVALQQRLESLLRVPVIQGYGSTEAGLIAQDAPDPRLRRAGSVGTAASAEIKITIMGEGGEPMPAGERGEILVRSPGVMEGYEGDPEANRLVFHEGWLRTGDLGYLDADGYLFITGRIKELINRGGLKVAPAEVDAVFIQHPAVNDAATVGMPHRSLGEDVVTAVILHPGQRVSAQELRAYALQRIAPFKAPSSVVLLSEFPRNALGKIRRDALVEILRERLRTEFVPPRDPLEGLVCGIFASLLELPQIGVFDNFFDRGGDSLLAVQALSRIRAQTGIEVEAIALFEAPTVEQFAQRLRRELSATPVNGSDAPRLVRRTRRRVGDTTPSTSD